MSRLVALRLRRLEQQICAHGQVLALGLTAGDPLTASDVIVAELLSTQECHILWELVPITMNYLSSNKELHRTELHTHFRNKAATPSGVYSLVDQFLPSFSRRTFQQMEHNLQTQERVSGQHARRRSTIAWSFGLLRSRATSS